jgi:hypothetical protein
MTPYASLNALLSASLSLRPSRFADLGASLQSGVRRGSPRTNAMIGAAVLRAECSLKIDNVFGKG